LIVVVFMFFAALFWRV